MPKFSYIAQRYSQGDSDKTLVSFTADATDILRWGGVPSKNERFHGGFQRALSARYRKIISYFDNGQISPGAIVVAFRPNALEMTELGYPSSWPDQSKNTSQAKFVHIEFSSEDYDALSLPELIKRVRSLLEQRPGFSTGGYRRQNRGNDLLHQISRRNGAWRGTRSMARLRQVDLPIIPVATATGSIYIVYEVVPRINIVLGVGIKKFHCFMVLV